MSCASVLGARSPVPGVGYRVPGARVPGARVLGARALGDGCQVPGAHKQKSKQLPRLVSLLFHGPIGSGAGRTLFFKQMMAHRTAVAKQTIS